MRSLVQPSTVVVSGLALALSLVAAPATAANDGAYAGGGVEEAVVAPALVEPAVEPAAVAPGAVDPGIAMDRYTHLIVYTYRDLLGRDPEPEGLWAWELALANGGFRGRRSRRGSRTATSTGHGS